MTPLTKVSPTNVTSNITIRDLQLNDSGLYTCSYKIYQDTEYRRQGSLEIHVVGRFAWRNCYEMKCWFHPNLVIL